MKGNSGHFSGTLGTAAEGIFQKVETYADRGIDVPQNIKNALKKLDKKGKYITGSKNDFSMKDVSVMSKESGVEFAKVIIGNKAYLIRGDEKGVFISNGLLDRLKKNGGNLAFHSHPHNDDLIPSEADRKYFLKISKITGQTQSAIVTPNGRKAVFNGYGIVSVGTVSNRINNEYKEFYSKIFGGE